MMLCMYDTERVFLVDLFIFMIVFISLCPSSFLCQSYLRTKHAHMFLLWNLPSLGQTVNRHSLGTQSIYPTSTNSLSSKRDKQRHTQIMAMWLISDWIVAKVYWTWNTFKVGANFVKCFHFPKETIVLYQISKLLSSIQLFNCQKQKGKKLETH